jgi:mRNA interferase HigB
MVIISKTMLNEFGLHHTGAAAALNEWYAIVKAADWNTLADVKQTFNSVDYVGNDHYVFNIKGNHYRLIAMIFFDKRTLFIRFVGTHAQYDKLPDCSTI